MVPEISEKNLLDELVLGPERLLVKRQNVFNCQALSPVSFYWTIVIARLNDSRLTLRAGNKVVHCSSPVRLFVRIASAPSGFRCSRTNKEHSFYGTTGTFSYNLWGGKVSLRNHSTLSKVWHFISPSVVSNSKLIKHTHTYTRTHLCTSVRTT